MTLLSARLTPDPAYNQGRNYNVWPDEYEYRLFPRGLFLKIAPTKERSVSIPFPLSHLRPDETKGIILAIKFSRFSNKIAEIILALISFLRFDSKKTKGKNNDSI